MMKHQFGSTLRLTFDIIESDEFYEQDACDVSKRIHDLIHDFFYTQIPLVYDLGGVLWSGDSNFNSALPFILISHGVEVQYQIAVGNMNAVLSEADPNLRIVPIGYQHDRYGS